MPAILNATLASLLAVRGVQSSDVFISRPDTPHGDTEAVTQVINSFAMASNVRPSSKAVSRQDENSKVHGQLSQARVSLHYQAALEWMFTHATPAQAIVVVQDGLVFSPDFSQFFLASYPLIVREPRIGYISAMNDNGFETSAHVEKQAPHNMELRRIEFMSGMAFLLTRNTYNVWLQVRWVIGSIQSSSVMRCANY